MSLPIKECKGCKEYTRPLIYFKNLKRCKSHLKPSFINKKNETMKCPCSICLVKGICKNACDKIIEYNHLYHMMLIHKNRKDKMENENSKESPM